jgi:hypothetical protein
MRTLVLVTLVAFGLASVTAAAVSTGGQKQPPSAAPSAKLPAPPPPVGRCRANRVLREQCTKQWDQCVVTAFPHGVNPCPGRWQTCCMARPRTEALTVKQKIVE